MYVDAETLEAEGLRGKMFVCVRGGTAAEAAKGAIEGDEWVEWCGGQGAGASVGGGEVHNT